MADTVVHNFSSFSPLQLAHLKNALSLSLSDEMLAHCMNHYRLVERRDPYTDELQALSALAEESERLPAASCIYDFTTPDEEIAKTYADVIAKRRINTPNEKHPPTLSEIAALASEELQRVGFPKRAQSVRAYDAPAAFFEDHAPTVTTASGTVRLRAAAPLAVGDVLVLLAPTAPTEGIERLPVTVKHSLRLGQNGILSSLLANFDAFSVNLTPFSEQGTVPPMTVLTGSAYCGAYVLCVAAKDLRPLLSFMKEHEIRGFAFATLSATNSITFLRHPAPAFSLRVDFLRTLFRRKRHTVTVVREDAPHAPIDRTPVALSTCPYLSDTAFRNGREGAFESGIFCTAASAPISSAGFQTAIYTLLTPVLSQAATGIPIKDQSLSLSLTYTSVEEALAAVLGVYRVQTELAITAHECRLAPAAPEQSSALNVFSLSESFPNASHLTHIGATVYCITVETGENGLPVFSRLKEKLSLLSHLNEDFLICAARVLVGESVIEGLEKMSTSLTYVPEEDLDALGEKLPLAILIESTARLPLPAVGRTVARENSYEEELPAVRPPRDSLIVSDRPELVLLATPEDRDAETLLSHLSERGAHARLFRVAENTDPLARALLTSHALILCKGAYPKSDPALGFAIETLLRAGGSILALYECEDATVLSLPDGIPAAILETLLTN